MSLVDGNVIYDLGNLFQSLAQGTSTPDTFTYTIDGYLNSTSARDFDPTIAPEDDEVLWDEFYINVIGDGWEIPLARTDVGECGSRGDAGDPHRHGPEPEAPGGGRDAQAWTLDARRDHRTCL